MFLRMLTLKSMFIQKNLVRYKMKREEFKEYLSENAQYLLFENLDKVHEMFDPFIEDDTLEEYVYEYDTSTNSLNISFTFKDGDPIVINLGRKS